MVSGSREVQKYTGTVAREMILTAVTNRVIRARDLAGKLIHSGQHINRENIENQAPGYRLMRM